MRSAFIPNSLPIFQRKGKDITNPIANANLRFAMHSAFADRRVKDCSEDSESRGEPPEAVIVSRHGQRLIIRPLSMSRDLLNFFC